MRPRRSVALFALVALVLLRGVGMAADAWTAGQIECCCGRHAADHDCGSNMCPSHLHGHGHAHDDGRSHFRKCGHHTPLYDTSASPEIALARRPVALAAPFASAAPDRPIAPPSSRLVHPETPPS